jgi:type VI secretion system secreted protein Hcp
MVDYFLKIDSVPGESHDAHHPDEIEVTSFAWGETNSGSPVGGGGGGGGKGGKVHLQDFHFSAVTSKASPKLMVLCANGKRVKGAVLTARRAGSAQQEFLKLTFTDVTVASYDISGTEPGVPIDSVSLNFSKVQIDYKPQNANGSLGAVVHGGWDLVQNKEF